MEVGGCAYKTKMSLSKEQKELLFWPFLECWEIKPWDIVGKSFTTEHTPAQLLTSIPVHGKNWNLFSDLHNDDKETLSWKKNWHIKYLVIIPSLT